MSPRGGQMDDNTDPRWEVIRPALSKLLGLDTCEDADLVRGLLEELLEQRAAAVADVRATMERIEALQGRIETLQANAISLQCESAYYRGRWQSATDEAVRAHRDLTRLRGEADDLRVSLAVERRRAELRAGGAK